MLGSRGDGETRRGAQGRTAGLGSGGDRELGRSGEPERQGEGGEGAGEKLFEELLNSETRVLPTHHEKILVVQAEPLDLDGLNEELSNLIEYAQIGDEKSLLAKLAVLAPGYLNGHAPTLMPQEKLGRILLLGKDAYTRMTLRHILQPRYVIFEAEDETDALRQVHARHPNLIILDFHLPEVNVRKLCANWIYKPIPVSILENRVARLIHRERTHPG